jgi:hypothetical protein
MSSESIVATERDVAKHVSELMLTMSSEKDTDPPRIEVSESQDIRNNTATILQANALILFIRIS